MLPLQVLAVPQLLLQSLPQMLLRQLPGLEAPNPATEQVEECSDTAPGLGCTATLLNCATSSCS